MQSRTKKTMLSEQLTGAYPANQGCVHCVCQIAKANVRHGHHHWSVGKSYTHVNSGPVHPVRPMLQPLALGKALDKTPDEIFAGWEIVKNKVGADEMKNIPFGAIARVDYADKIAFGLQQFMAEARKFNMSQMTRDDLMAANRETAAETGIAYMADSLDESAKAILNA